MNFEHKKQLLAVVMTAVLASPIAATSFALADNNAGGSVEEQADITNWIANTPQQISNNMAMQHIDTNNLNGTRYIIQWGDTLSGISAATGISVAKLCYDNHIQNANLIYAGDVLILNRNGSVPEGYNPNVNPNVVAQTKVTINNGPTNVNIVVKPQSITTDDHSDNSTNVYSADDDSSSASNSSSDHGESDQSSSHKQSKATKLSTKKIVANFEDAADDDDKLSFEKFDADEVSDDDELDTDVEEEITDDIKDGNYDDAIKTIKDHLDDKDSDATIYLKYSKGKVLVWVSQSNDDSDDDNDNQSSNHSSHQQSNSNDDEDTDTTDDDE